MKYIKNKAAFMLLAVIVLAGVTATPATASNIDTSGGASTIPAEVTAAAATFSVTLPTSIPIQVQADGSVIVASNLGVTNNSSGPVIVNGVSTAGKNGWAVVEFGRDYSTSKVGLKEIGLSLNNSETAGPGSLTLGESDWPSINSQSTLKIDCKATIAPQPGSIRAQVADIVFTVGWLKADSGEDEGGDSGNTVVLGAESFELDPDTGLLRYSGTPDKIEEYLAKTSGVLNIPGSIDGVAVAGISDSGLSGLDSLGEPVIKLVLPSTDTFKYVGTLQEVGNTLVELDLGSATEMAESMLSGSSTIEKVVLDGSKLNTIPNRAFRRCTSLSSINLEGVINIGDEAFMQCDALPKDVLPKSIRSVGDYSFNGGGGDSAPELMVPAGIESIGFYAFGGHKVYYTGRLKDDSGNNWGATEIVGVVEGLDMNPDHLELGVGQSAQVIVQKLPIGTADTTMITVENNNPETISAAGGGSNSSINVGIAGIKVGSGTVTIKCGNITRVISVSVHPN